MQVSSVKLHNSTSSMCSYSQSEPAVEPYGSIRAGSAIGSNTSIDSAGSSKIYECIACGSSS